MRCVWLVVVAVILSAVFCSGFVFLLTPSAREFLVSHNSDRKAAFRPISIHGRGPQQRAGDRNAVLTPRLPPRVFFVYGDRVKLQWPANKEREGAMVLCLRTLKKESL